MTPNMLEAGTDGQVTVSVSSAVSVTARMPSPAECWRYGFARDVPMLAVRDAKGKERLFAADRTALILSE